MRMVAKVRFYVFNSIAVEKIRLERGPCFSYIMYPS